MEFDEFGQKVKDKTIEVANMAGEVAKSIGKKAGDMIEEGKLSSRIKDAEAKIEASYTQLGIILYNNKDLLCDDDRVARLIAGIDETKETVLKYKRDIALLRGEIYCETCGNFAKADSQFCSKCGSGLK